MGQRLIRRVGLSGWPQAAFFAVLATLAAGCDKSQTAATAPAATGPTTQAAPPATPVRIASLVPSATDLLIGAGMADHLVAVCKYDRSNPQAAGFPTAGDYQSTDWELLTQLKPTVMLVFMAPDHLPPGMKSRCGHVGHPDRER